ncbi:hypothetical protein HJC23_010777 [Cyclotella cryptica]|uniref:Helicase-associated domain-containing protein n=1 Tax=Cyclotella cryptica TaxID=29204 RepID=A0ABD3PW22_9STRA
MNGNNNFNRSPGVGNPCHPLSLTGHSFRKYPRHSFEPLYFSLVDIPGVSTSRFPNFIPGINSYQHLTNPHFTSAAALASLPEVIRKKECTDYGIAHKEMMVNKIAVNESIRFHQILLALTEMQLLDMSRNAAHMCKQGLRCVPSRVDSFSTLRTLKLSKQSQPSTILSNALMTLPHAPGPKHMSSGETAKAPDAAELSKSSKRLNILTKSRARIDLRALWYKRYGELVEFHEANGHCDVPQRYAANIELGRWVKDQRTFQAKGMLSQERIELLNKIGFSWRIRCHNDFWEKRCREMVDYKNAHGHCNVSISDPANCQLARWVDRQRRARKLGKISEERVKQLDDIGFIWSVR